MLLPFFFFNLFFLKNTDHLPENQVVINACEDLVCKKCSAETSEGYENMGKLSMSNLMRKNKEEHLRTLSTLQADFPLKMNTQFFTNVIGVTPIYLVKK